MKRADIPLSVPCGVDFRTMSPVDRGRLCARCKTVVYDLSSMTEVEARALMARRDIARLCVRYVYDGDERVVFAGERDTKAARIIPEYRLTARGKARMARAALLTAPLVLFEACGTSLPGDKVDAGDVGRLRAEAGVADTGGDGGDARTGDAENEASSDGGSETASDAVGDVVSEIAE